MSIIKEDIKPKHFCEGCEEMVDEVFEDYGYKLCSECNDNYHNVSGHCPLRCCVTGHCDQSC